MRKLLYGTVALTPFLALLGPQTANADNISIATSLVSPPPWNTVVSGPSPILGFAGNTGTFSYTVTAEGTPPLPEPTLDTSTITVNASGAGTLFLAITETGLTANINGTPLTSGLTTNNFTGEASGNSESTFLSSTNGLYTGTLLNSAQCLNPPGTACAVSDTSSTINGVTGPYSLTAVYELSFIGAGSISAQIDIQDDGTPSGGPVPEPASLALFGTGLLGLGFLRRRGFFRKG